MKYIISILILFLPIVAHAFPEIERQHLPVLNILNNKNPGFENGTQFWTASGGTFTTDSTAANVGNGNYSGKWTASASSQTLKSALITIPAGLYGKNCLGHINYKGGDANLTLSVTDGTNTLVSQVLSAATNYTNVDLSFICPSSGSLQLQVSSSAAASVIYLDDNYLGSNYLVGQVSQATLVGGVVISGCNNQFIYNTSSYASPSTPGTCVYTPFGSALSPTSTVVGAKFSSLPPGEYLIEYEGQWGDNTANKAAYAKFSDGTVTAREESSVINFSAATFSNSVVQSFTYTTAQTNVTWQLLGKVDTVSNMYVVGGTSAGGVNVNGTVKLYRFPTYSQQAVNINAVPNSWSGYHNGSCTFTTSSTTYADLTNANASCNIVEQTNANFGTVTSYGGTGASAKAGIIFTPAKTGNYTICVSGASTFGSSTATGAAYELMDGSGTLIASNASAGNNANFGVPTTLCGIYKALTATSTTIKLQAKISAGGASTNFASQVSSSDPTLFWQVFPVDQNFPMPVIVNSVASPNAGQVKIASAKITNSGGNCAVSYQDGSWISSISNAASAVCNLTITGAFSSAPICTITPENGASAVVAKLNTTVTTSLVQVDTFTSSSASDTPSNFHIICMGPK